MSRTSPTSTKTIARASLGLALVIGLALTGPGPARADTPSRLELELAAGVSGSLELRSVILTAPLFTLSAPISDENTFIAQWGFALATGDPTRADLDPTFLAPGNPLFGLSLRLAEGLLLSPSVTLPLARMSRAESRRPAATFAFEGALGLRGGLDRWLWLPDRLSLVLPVTFARWLDPILIETHVKLALLLPMVSDPLSAVPRDGRREAAVDEILLQSELRLAARLGEGIWFGTRFSLVYIPTSDGEEVELALSPELRMALGPWSHVELGVTLNLGQTLGPSWEPGRFWAVVLGGSTPL